MIYFISDTHWGHANIIKYCNRPYQSVQEMDAALITNWNAVVKPEDEIYHLGDFTFYRDPVKVGGILNRLNGKKYFIWGNHDQVFKKNPYLLDNFVWSKDYYELKTPGNPPIVLMHYPILVWNGGHHGSIMLHGHDHGGVDYLDKPTTRYDVGVDAEDNNQFPVSLDKIMKVMSTRKYVPMDQHGKEEM